MKKTVAKAGVAGLILLGVTECHMITAPAVLADEYEVQTLNINYKPFDMFEIIKPQEFARISADIEEDANPWLDPESSSIQMSKPAIIEVLKNAGFTGSGLEMAQLIVQLESTNRPYAHNNNPATGDNSYGLFQINMYRGLEESRQKAYSLDSNEELFDPLTNAKIAYKISKGGTSWSAWTTYPKAKDLLSN
jgi:hypothetical protein